MRAKAPAAGALVDLERLLPEGTGRRRLLQRALGAGQRPIVVASMSRAGSTMLHAKLAVGWTKARFGAYGPALLPCFAEAAWRLDETPLIGGVVYKTHDLPQHLPRAAKAKVLFTYRRASDVVLSIADCHARLGKDWFRSHRRNMRGRGGAFLREDPWGLEAQIDAWSQAEGVDVLGLRFETLWDHVREIEDFVGFRVPLRRRQPSGRQRPPSELAERVAETYGALDRKIAAMPDVFLRSA